MSEQHDDPSRARQAARPLLVVCADGGAAVGAGHLGRGVALAQAWIDSGGRAELVVPSVAEAIARHLASDDLEVFAGAAECPAALAAHLESRNPGWVALDGYRFGRAWQRAARVGGSFVLVVDDDRTIGTYEVDAVLDQNPGARPAHYSELDPSRVRSGTHFALLRRQYRVPRHPCNRTAPADRVVMLAGGSPSAELRSFVLATAAIVGRRAPVDVVLPEYGSRTTPPAPAVRIHDFGSVKALADGATVAFTTAGSTLWELSCLGVPAVALTVAANQVAVLAAMAELGAAVSLGELGEATPEAAATTITALLDSPHERAEIARAANALCDGHGALRVVAWLRALTLRLRPVVADDASTLFTMVNDPVTRESSFSREPIEWTSHCAWLQRRLQSDAPPILLASDEDGLVGQIRFDLTDDAEVAEVDVTVAPERRGQGHAAPLIIAGTETMFADRRVRRIRALVRQENQRSQRAFLTAGYRRTSGSTLHGAAVTILELERQ
jgi:spore coat polysaccharide biosynthesis predicted glycosyltransferase SpsG/RimJ/RimL family protein N-acetyltransferase